MRQREIKFRYKHKNDDTILEWQDLKSFKPDQWMNRDDIIVMQFTGLVDSKEREIWEFDIIKYHHRTKEIDYVGVVRWNNHHAGFMIYNGQKALLNKWELLEDNFFMLENDEVIGNYIENPELLK